ncbi:MAG: hypothetical protein WCQ59_06875 [Candidatus Cloacimonadaceae bacterium]|jgi:hypothetical protein|nr:hypothetical protein [Candidatus Cloacimonadota bacterium]
MKVHIYLSLLSVLMLSACTHLDNCFLRSAEPLPKGKARGTASLSSSYSYAPALNFEPDSTLGLNSRPREAELGFQLPAGVDLGLGNGFQVGGQLALALAESHSWPSLTTSFRGYLQYSLPIRDSYWLGFAPGILYHQEDVSLKEQEPWPWGQIDEPGYLLEQRGIGGEFPLTISRVKYSKDKKISHSLTFRYGIIRVSSKINEYRSIFHNDIIYDQADQNISRYAAIYTWQWEKGIANLSLDLGIEFSDKKGMVVPVVGIKRLFDLPWGNKPTFKE